MFLFFFFLSIAIANTMAGIKLENTLIRPILNMCPVSNVAEISHVEAFPLVGPGAKPLSDTIRHSCLDPFTRTSK